MSISKAAPSGWPEHSKNKKGPVLPLVGELGAIIDRAAAAERLACPAVFVRDDGRAVGLFRKSWATACKNAGLRPLIVHDLRRSAIKNMVDARVPETTAMAISGHKTRSTFDRYSIVTTEAVAKALEATGDYLAAQPRIATKVVPITKRSA